MLPSARLISISSRRVTCNLYNHRVNLVTPEPQTKWLPHLQNDPAPWISNSVCELPYTFGHHYHHHHSATTRFLQPLRSWAKEEEEKKKFRWVPFPWNSESGKITSKSFQTVKSGMHKSSSDSSDNICFLFNCIPLFMKTRIITRTTFIINVQRTKLHLMQR